MQFVYFDISLKVNTRHYRLPFIKYVLGFLKILKAAHLTVLVNCVAKRLLS